MAETRPDSPDFVRVYQTTLSTGRCCVEISAPGNRVPAEDAEWLLKWFELIFEQLRRDVHRGTDSPSDPEDEMVECGDCGQRMTLVRPGKWQCNNPSCDVL